MAGRPRTMAKRIERLYDSFAQIVTEYEELMPDQYRQPTTDSLGRSWQEVSTSLAGVDRCLFDLVCELTAKALRAEGRASANDANSISEADSPTS